MKLTRKLAALAMAVLLAVSLTACSPKEWAQNVVVHLVHKLGLVEESDEEDTDTTTKAPAGGSVEFPAEMDTDSARVVTYPVDDTLYVSFNGIANRSTEYFVAGGDSMTVTGYASTEASSENYMYFKIAFWELSDDKTMTSYVPDSTIYFRADEADYQYTITGLTAGKQYKITISYDNGNKYYVTDGLKGAYETELVCSRNFAGALPAAVPGGAVRDRHHRCHAGGCAAGLCLGGTGRLPCLPRSLCADDPAGRARQRLAGAAGAAQHYRPAEPDDGGAAALCRSGQPGRPGNGDAARLCPDCPGAAIIFRRVLSGCPACPSVLP